MLARWTRALLRWRALVVVAWLAVVATGAVAATQLPGLLSNTFTVPGSGSGRTADLLAEHFGERPEGTFTVVFEVERSSDPAARRAAERALERAAAAVPGGIAGEVSRGRQVLYGDVATTLELHEAKRFADDVRAALGESRGPPALVTGQPALQADLDPVFAADVRRGEAIALPIAFLVLLGLLGLSVAVALPFVFAACTITATLAVLWGLAHVVPTVSYVANLVWLLGLGLAVDYSVLVVYRFREELARGHDRDEAIVRTMTTAGRTVVLSGTAVAIGLATLLAVPVPFIRSMGIAGLLIPLASMAATLTLQPVLLSFLGERGVRRVRVLRRPGGADAWARLARAILRRPAWYLAAGVALLAALAVPALWLHVSPGSISSVPGSPESVRAFELLRDRVGPGAVTPIQIVVDAERPGGVRAGEPAAQATDRLVDAIYGDPEAYVVATGRKPPYVDDQRRHRRVIVVSRHEYGEDETQDLLGRIRDGHVPGAGFPAAAAVPVGGVPAQAKDFIDRSYGAFPWVVLAVCLATYAVLLRAFRSVLLPLKAVLANLLTLGAVYGVLVAVFQWGVGADLLGLDSTGVIEAWVPIFLFATLFGLSMDYEVFLVSRMREARDAGETTERAIALGLERSGRIVTGAALIMVAAFSGFVAGRIDGLQQFGFGLVVGVVLDATVVRVLVVPAAMALLGRWCWWLPTRVARLARAAPST